MLEQIVLAVSAALQFTAAVMAVRLIRLTGFFWASFSLASAVTLMGIRRSITLYRVIDGQQQVDLTAEFVALVISIFMVTGIVRIAPLFFLSKRAEQIRVVSEQKFRRLADAVHEPVLLHDREGRIRDSNPAACGALGYGAPELQSLSMADVESGWTPERIGEALKRRFEHGAPEFEREYRRKDGSHFVSAGTSLLVGVEKDELVLSVLRLGA